MDQEKICNFIKKIRKDNNLTQKEFAKRLNVTYQAVSKWENCKNIPDLSILKQISKDYNVSLDEILDGDYYKKQKSKKIIMIFLMIATCLMIVVLSIFFLNNRNNDFEFKTLSSSCNNFTIHGSISYNYQKSAIFISNIDYCGGEDNTKYDSIECILYENNESAQNKISSYIYDKEEKITLEEFLKQVTFSIDNYNQVCKTYNKDSLSLVINAKLEEKTINYNIPLSLNDNCK